jgi:membrane-associated phospholipid phosphatase
MTRPPLARLGGNRITAGCLLLQASVLALTVGLGAAMGLRYDWRAAGPFLVLPGGAALVWAYYAWVPGRQAADWVVAETACVLALLLGFGLIMAPAQYVAAALPFPLIDAQLAAGDAALGIHIPTLVAWTRTHPWLVQALFRTYGTLLPQLFLPVLVLGFWYRDRAKLWEYAVLVHGCLAVTLLVSAVWPATCVSGYFGFDAILDQHRLIAHFASLRAGTFTVIHPDQIEGLVSPPSFHTAGALLACWAFRGRWAWLAPLIGVNVGLIAATVCLGLHYGVDVIAGAALVAVSVAAAAAVPVTARDQAFGGFRRRGDRTAGGTAAPARR